jgi:hypothetical protein
MHSNLPLSPLTHTNLQAEQEEQQFTKTITDLWDAPNDPYSTYVGQRVPEIPFSYQKQRVDTSNKVPPTYRQPHQVRSHRPTSRSRSLSPQQHSEPPSPFSSSTSSSPIKGNHFRRAEYRDPTPPRGEKPPSILKRPNGHKARLERPGESSVDGLSTQRARSVKFADSPTNVEQIYSKSSENVNNQTRKGLTSFRKSGSLFETILGSTMSKRSSRLQSELRHYLECRGTPLTYADLVSKIQVYEERGLPRYNTTPSSTAPPALASTSW